MQPGEIIKFFQEKILPDLQLQNPDFQAIDKKFSKILKESDQKTRDEMEKLLRVWTARVLYINFAREAKEEEI